MHKAIHNATATPVAIKVVPVSDRDELLEESVKEVSFLRGTQSPYIVRLYGSYLWDGFLWIVMEYCAAGSVLEVMRVGDGVCVCVCVEADVHPVHPPSPHPAAHAHPAHTRPWMPR